MQAICDIPPPAQALLRLTYCLFSRQKGNNLDLTWRRLLLFEAVNFVITYCCRSRPRYPQGSVALQCGMA